MRVRLGQVAVVLVSIVATVAVYQVWSAATEMWSALEGDSFESAEATPARQRRHPSVEGADEEASEGRRAERLSPSVSGADRIRLASPDADEVDAAGTIGAEPTRAPSSGSIREARARWREGLSEEERQAHRARRREQRLARTPEERAVRHELRERKREGAGVDGAPGEGPAGGIPEAGDTD